MTRVTACFLLAFMIAGQAQELPEYIAEYDGSTNKESIPMSLATWASLLSIVGLENQRDGGAYEFLTHVAGLDGRVADALINFAYKSVSERRALAADQNRRTCERRKDLATRSELAAELEQNKMVRNLYEEALLSRIVTDFRWEDAEKIVDWIDNRRVSMKVTSGDLSLMFEIEDIDPRLVLDRKCGQSNTQADVGGQ